LHFGRRAIDFVGEYQIVKYGSGLEFKFTVFRTVNVTAGDVGGEQIGRELDAVKVAFDHFGQGGDGLGLGKARGAFDQQVAVCQQGHHQALGEVVLTDNTAIEK